ncbi:MAG: 50S ribosomal protein L29 [Candidatus Omnitrophota bacterium]
MKTKELRDLNVDDLIQKEKTLKKDLFDLNFQRQVGSLEKSGRYKVIRRDIARIKTIIKEKELKKQSETK